MLLHQLNWTFPEETSETNFSWNLYRLNQKPAELDLRFLAPILTGIENKLEKVKHSLIMDPHLMAFGLIKCTTMCSLQPITSVTKIRLQTIQVKMWSEQKLTMFTGNSKWRIPEPPPPEEPPLGSEWVGSVYDGIREPCIFKRQASIPVKASSC